MSDDPKPAFYIPPGLGGITVQGQTFYTNRQKTRYEREVAAALEAAIRNAPIGH